MTPAFKLFYEHHLAVVEGGVVDHPNDPGGATWYGISQRFLINIGQSGPVSRIEAKRLAFEFFWMKYGCEEMDPVAAWSYCDALFNHSPRAAGKMLQHALGVGEDGVVGVKTRAAARSINRRQFIERYRLRRVRYFVAIVKARPASMDFLVGWMDRIHILNQSMLIAGLLSEDLRSLDWGVRTRSAEYELVEQMGRVLATWRAAQAA